MNGKTRTPNMGSTLMPEMEVFSGCVCKGDTKKLCFFPRRPFSHSSVLGFFHQKKETQSSTLILATGTATCFPVSNRPGCVKSISHFQTTHNTTVLDMNTSMSYLAIVQKHDSTVETVFIDLCNAWM